jgi:hypothetical protein
MMGQVLLDKDLAALQGLEDSGKTLFLARGTKFEGLDFPDDLVLGYVKSGRNIGRECYIFKVCLQDNPPRKSRSE